MFGEFDSLGVFKLFKNFGSVDISKNHKCYEDTMLNTWTFFRFSMPTQAVLLFRWALDKSLRHVWNAHGTMHRGELPLVICYCTSTWHGFRKSDSFRELFLRYVRTHFSTFHCNIRIDFCIQDFVNIRFKSVFYLKVF